MADEALALAAAALERLRQLEQKGIKAHKGDKGKDGRDGATGARGPQGLRGSQGERGPRGQTGPQGRPGVDGRQGPRGIRGEAGPKGPIGPRGTGIQGAELVGRDLIVRFDDGSTTRLEGFAPRVSDGVGIANVALRNEVLTVTLTDGRRIDAGRIPSGGSGVSRNTLLKLVQEVNPIAFEEIEVEGETVARLVAVS